MGKKPSKVSVREHDEECLCSACFKRLLKAHDKYMQAWLKKAERRFSELEKVTSPHYLAGYWD